MAAIEQFSYQLPRGNVPLLLYQAIDGHQGGKRNIWFLEFLLFFVLALYAGAIVWITSRRSRVAPATLVVGTGAGLVLGAVMYVVAPLGLSKAATNPWLPGNEIDPFVLLAWILVLCGPWAAGALAYRRYMASSAPPPPIGVQVRQVVAAGILANLVGALFVAVLGTGTIALMINASWLRNWLYHGRHLLFGVAGLQPVLRGNPGAITYSHEITAVSDAGALVAVCIGFLVIAALETGFVAWLMWETSRMEPDDPRRGDGGQPDPGYGPDRPGHPQPLNGTHDDPASVVGAISLYARNPKVENTRVLIRTTDVGRIEAIAR